MQNLKNKVNIGVGLVMILMIIPSFFTPLYVKDINTKTYANTQKNVQPTEIKNTSDLWTSIPRRAVAYTNLTVYSDKKLTNKVGQIKAKTQLSLVKLVGNAFELSDKKYISANKKEVISDVAISRFQENHTVYISKTVNVLYAPFTTFDHQVLTQLKGNQVLQSEQVAKTQWGRYYEVTFNKGQKGWVSSEDISLENPKLSELQKLLNQKYNNKDYSIYVEDINSGFTAGVNQKNKMYSASLSKIPILYWTQKRINEGLASLTDELLYSAGVNGWNGAYEAEGTGTLPKIADNKSYNLLDVINRTVKSSDNVGSNLLSYYETDRFASDYQNEISKISGEKWNPDSREASAQMVGKVLKGLYSEGGASFNALFDTDFDKSKIKAGVPQNVRVAHKIGTADEYNHDAAIIFSNQPYVLVIESIGATDKEIQKISSDVYEVMK